jgi:monoamine oxidase
MLSPRELRDSWSGATPVPFWLDHADRPAPRPALDASVSIDLTVVGGGFSGLWTALLSKERDPGRQVVLIEADRVASAATGRNGGFCAASLTHGERNGQVRFPGEFGALAVNRHAPPNRQTPSRASRRPEWTALTNCW